MWLIADFVSGTCWSQPETENYHLMWTLMLKIKSKNQLTKLVHKYESKSTAPWPRNDGTSLLYSYAPLQSMRVQGLVPLDQHFCWAPVLVVSWWAIRSHTWQDWCSVSGDAASATQLKPKLDNRKMEQVPLQVAVPSQNWFKVLDSRKNESNLI